MNTNLGPFCLCGNVAFCRGLCRSCYEKWRLSRPGSDKIIERNREKSRNWYRENRSRRLERYSREKLVPGFLEANRERAKRYRATHPITVQQRESQKRYFREYAKRTAVRNWEKWVLQRKYGLSREQWDKLLIESAGRCYLCGEPMKKPVVDHDHKTGKVRGLLCSYCNRWLGTVEKYPEIVSRVVTHLAKGNL